VRPGRTGAGASAADPDRLQALYAATQELMAARTREALCDAVVATAESVLELPHVAVHVATDGRLAPVATTSVAAERFDGDPPVYGRTHPLWEVYADSETLRVAETDGWDGPVATGVAVPVGDHGVLQAGRQGDGSVEDAAVELVRLLGTNAAVALDRLRREHRLDRLHEAARELMRRTRRRWRRPRRTPPTRCSG